MFISVNVAEFMVRHKTIKVTEWWTWEGGGEECWHQRQPQGMFWEVFGRLELLGPFKLFKIVEKGG